MHLSFSDKQKYNNQVKGFKGECLFDTHVNHPQQNGLVINDLLLSTKSTYYQMDSILILNQHIYLYEVKNYAGSYWFEEDSLYTKSGHLIQNSQEQLNRKKAYLHNLILNMGFNYSITSYVTFVHPDFYIYLLPPTDSFVFSGGLENHFKEIFNQNITSTVSEEDMRLAHTLIRKHHSDYRPNHLPNYNISNLKVGIFCPKCFSFHYIKTRNNRTCAVCGFEEKIADAIYRMVLEFKMLFPEKSITVQNIFIWCGQVYSKYRIRYLLKKKFTLNLKGPQTFYE